MIATEAPISAEDRAMALAERVFNATIEVADLTTIYLGDRLGYYRALAELGEVTPAELAAKAGTNERYTREWLEQQAVTGILTVEDTGNPALQPAARTRCRPDRAGQPALRRADGSPVPRDDSRAAEAG